MTCDDIPATWGGPKFRPRKASHHQELDGSIWSCCGVNSEYSPLQSVIMAWPGQSLGEIEDPDQALMLAPVNLDRIRRQARALQSAYEALSVTVFICDPTSSPANFIFMRDLFFMTPEGAILGRPAAQQRAGEERHAAQALAGLGVPILATLRGKALFEGADALWLDTTTVLIGQGMRTNAAGVATVSALLQTMEIEVLTVDMPPQQQHLLGLMNIIDRHLVVIDQLRVPDALRSLLLERNFELIELQNDRELRGGRGMNFVTIRPGEVLMPAHCPEIESQLAYRGVVTHSVEVGEYLNAGGGLACLSGIVNRAPPKQSDTGKS